MVGFSSAKDIAAQEEVISNVANEQMIFQKQGEIAEELCVSLAVETVAESMQQEPLPFVSNSVADATDDSQHGPILQQHVLMGEVMREAVDQSLADGANFSPCENLVLEDDQQLPVIAAQQNVPATETPVEEEKKEVEVKVDKKTALTDVGNDGDVETVDFTGKDDNSKTTPGSLEAAGDLQELEQFSEAQAVSSP